MLPPHESRRLSALRKKINPKVKEQCVQTPLSSVPGNPTAVAQVVAKRNEMNAESVRRSYPEAQSDSGDRRGATSEELANIEELKAKVRRLEDDNDILRRATVFLAGEVDSRDR